MAAVRYKIGTGTKAWKTHAVRLIVGVAVATSLLPGPAAAFSFLGFTFFEDQSAIDAKSVIADPQPYTAETTIVGLDNAGADTVRNASQLWTGRNAPASGAAGLLATTHADYQSIVAALYDLGYYGGSVTITVDGKEATTLPADASLARPAKVKINVKAGPQFRFGTITTATETRQLAADQGLISGQIAQAGVVRRAARAALDFWKSQGYAKAKVVSQDIVANHDTNRLDVKLGIDPGRKAAVGTVSVQGASAVESGFIIHQAGLVPGTRYSPADLARARQRLAALNVFDVIQIVEADAIGADGTLPLTIVVKERKSQRVGAGATYSTTDGLGLETFWLNRNLFGRAERLRIDAKLAGIAYPIQSADFDYYFGGTFTKPGVLTADTDLVAELITQRTVLTHYTETSIEGRLGLSQAFTRQFSATYGLSAKRSQFVDSAGGVKDFTLIGAYTTTTFDTRNDKTDASGGVYLNAGAEPFYETQYGNLGLRLTGEARSYVALDPKADFVLAGRLRFGALFGPPTSEIPSDKLFFAGGGGSVRGYSYRSIGVVNPSGTVTGGTYLAEGSIEARAKLNAEFGAVGFLDAGYVTDGNFTDLATALRLGTGVGLRYYTGFGPLRLDFAIPLNKRTGDPDYALYVGIGQAF